MLLMPPPFEHDVAESVGAAEGAVDDVDRQALVLVEHADRGAPDVRPGVVADVVEEAAVDHLEPPAAHEDRAAAVVLGLALRVAVDEGEVLHRELRVVLVWQWSVVQHLRLVAGVHVEDPHARRRR